MTFGLFVRIVHDFAQKTEWLGYIAVRFGQNFVHSSCIDLKAGLELVLPDCAPQKLVLLGYNIHQSVQEFVLNDCIVQKSALKLVKLGYIAVEWHQESFQPD